MPIGLFENELTVQFWKPVTIRGYTFNVGDNVTLDQNKVQKTPSVGGDFAWLYRHHHAGANRHQLRDLLEPAASPAGSRGKQGADALVCPVPARSLRDPSGRSVPDAAVPLRQGGRQSHARDRRARRLLRRPRRRRVPLPDDSPAAGRATSPSANEATPTISRRAGR